MACWPSPIWDEEKADDRSLHARRFGSLAKRNTRYQAADSARCFWRSGGAFAFAANAKRCAQAIQDRHAVCAVSHSPERIGFHTRVRFQTRFRRSEFDSAA